MPDKSYFIKSSYTDDWTKWVHEHPKLSKLDLKMIKSIDAHDNEFILEIGAGEGKFGRLLLSKAGIVYVGLDISHRILTYAKNKFRKADYTTFYLVTADAEFLPFKRSMEKIFYYNSLFFIPTRYKTFTNARSVLKAHGKLIIDSNNILNSYYIIVYINGKIRYFAKKIANKIGLIRKAIKFIRKRDYNPYFRPGSIGNLFIILWELRRLRFQKIKYSGMLTIFQEYCLRFVPIKRVKQLIQRNILKYFSGRLILEAQM